MWLHIYQRLGLLPSCLVVQKGCFCASHPILIPGSKKEEGAKERLPPFPQVGFRVWTCIGKEMRTFLSSLCLKYTFPSILKVAANHRNHSSVSKMGDFVTDGSHRRLWEPWHEKKISECCFCWKIVFNVIIKNSVYSYVTFIFLHFDSSFSV